MWRQKCTAEAIGTNSNVGHFPFLQRPALQSLSLEHKSTQSKVPFQASNSLNSGCISNDSERPSDFFEAKRLNLNRTSLASHKRVKKVSAATPPTTDTSVTASGKASGLVTTTTFDFRFAFYNQCVHVCASVVLEGVLGPPRLVPDPKPCPWFSVGIQQKVGRSCIIVPALARYVSL